MISRDSIQTAYSFLHQKRNVYIHSTIASQRDDIELIIANYIDEMNPELLALVADGHDDFLKTHSRFQADITQAVERLEQLL